MSCIFATSQSSEVLRQAKELERWPLASAKRAANLLTKKEHVHLLLDILEKGKPAAKEGAAFCLGKLREKKAYPILHSFVKQREMRTRLTTTFRSMVLIHKTKAYQDIIDFIKTSPSLGHKDAYNALFKITTEEHIPILKELYQSRSYRTRLLSIRLMNAIKKQDMFMYFVKALEDDSPYVVSQALEILGNIPLEKIKKYFSFSNIKNKNQTIQNYALLILVLQEDSSKEIILNDEWLSLVWQNIRHTNPFVKCCATVALVNFGLRTEDPHIIELLDKYIPPTLIDILSGTVYFKEYLVVKDIAHQKLIQLTGKNFGKNMALWRDWWSRNGKNFRSIRLLQGITQDEIHALRLIYYIKNATKELTYLYTAKQEKEEEKNFERIVYLNNKQATELVNVLGKTKYFEMPQEYGNRLDTYHKLEITLQNKVKTVIVYGLHPGNLSPILHVLGKHTTENIWQLYWDNYKRPDWDVWFQEESEWFLKNTNKKQRNQRLKKMILESYAWLKPNVRDIAVQDLLELMQENSEMTSAMVQWGLTHIQTEMELNFRTQKLIQSLALAKNELAIHSIIEFLLLNYTPIARQLLIDTLIHAKTPILLQYIRHANFRIRSVVVEVLGDKEPEEIIIPWVMALLQDSQTEVLEQTLLTLGKWKLKATWEDIYEILHTERYLVTTREKALLALTMIDPEKSRPICSALLTSQEEHMRAAVAKALVMIGDTISLRTLWQILQSDPSLLVRETAKKSLIENQQEQSIQNLLLSLALQPSTTQVRLQALNILEQFDDCPLEELQPLLKDQDTKLQLQVAKIFANQYHIPTIPIFIRALSHQEQDKEIQYVLEKLTLQKINEETKESLSNSYKQWWKHNKHIPYNQIIFKAFKTRGYQVSSMIDYLLTNKPNKQMIPLLLTTIQDENWYIQAISNHLLQQITQQNYGTIRHHTGKKIQQEIHKSWQNYYKQQNNQQEKTN